MTTTSINDLLVRVESLERQNLRLRATGGTILAAVLVVLAMGQAAPSKGDVPDVLRARRFEIVDEVGTRRVHLGAVDTSQSGDGYGFELFNAKGISATTFGCRDDGSQAFWMRDPAKPAQVRISMGVSAGVAEFQLADGEQNGRIRLRVRKEGPATVSLLAQDGAAVEGLSNGNR